MPNWHDAGDAGDWFVEITAAVQGRGESTVPCGECSACCTAAQFVLIEPDEAAPLAAVPPDLLFPAPGMPPGHVLLGYDQAGRCPMLVDGRCSIYSERPRACRVYDCRLFAAAGVTADEPGKEGVRRRVDAWRFSVRTPQDQARLDAIRAAAAFLARNEATAGLSSTALALGSLRVHSLFYSPEGPLQPDPEAVLAMLRTS